MQRSLCIVDAVGMLILNKWNQKTNKCKHVATGVGRWHADAVVDY